MSGREKHVFVPQFGSLEACERKVAEYREANAHLPEYNWCGMCCAAMISRATGRHAPDVSQLYEKAFDYGVYQKHKGGIKGAYHRELARFIRKELGLPTKALRGLKSPSDLTRLIAMDRFFIASVSAQIRHAPLALARTGHLVLVYGFAGSQDHPRDFLLLNPSGYARNVSHIHQIPADWLFGCFSGNGVAVCAKASDKGQGSS